MVYTCNSTVRLGVTCAIFTNDIMKTFLKLAINTCTWYILTSKIEAKLFFGLLVSEIRQLTIVYMIYWHDLYCGG